MDLAVERHPLLEREVAGHQLTQDGLHALGLDLREEADLAQVHAEQGHVHLGHGPGRPQESAVAAEHDERAGSGQFADQSRSLARGGRPVVDAPHLAPTLGPLAQVQRRLLGGVVGEADAIELHMPASSPNLERPLLRQLDRDGPGGHVACRHLQLAGRTRDFRPAR